MHEKPQPENEIEENREVDDLSVWSNDQQKKSYYYDDSYGYEIYNPDESDDNDAENEVENEALKNKGFQRNS